MVLANFLILSNKLKIINSNHNAGYILSENKIIVKYCISINVLIKNISLLLLTN